MAGTPCHIIWTSTIPAAVALNIAPRSLLSFTLATTTRTVLTCTRLKSFTKGESRRFLSQSDLRNLFRLRGLRSIRFLFARDPKDFPLRKPNTTFLMSTFLKPIFHRPVRNSIESDSTLIKNSICYKE